MKSYNVVYRSKDSKPLDVEIFQCQAEDYEHAEDQTEDANSGCDILWIDNEENPQDTLENWLTS